MIPELFINKNSEFTFVSFSSSHSLVDRSTACDFTVSRDHLVQSLKCTSQLDMVIGQVMWHSVAGYLTDQNSKRLIML